MTLIARALDVIRTFWALRPVPRRDYDALADLVAAGAAQNVAWSRVVRRLSARIDILEAQLGDRSKAKEPARRLILPNGRHP